MAGETLEAIFVQREALAADLVERIRESVLTPTKLHTLMIGARGMGKTHLVSLVYHRVQKMSDLKEKQLIAWLREEEWGVTSFLDLLLRIFRALGENDPTIEEQTEALFDLSAAEAEAAGQKLLNELIGKRTLLLIVENLDDLFSGLGEQGQQHLRAFLQTYANCTILATSSRLFNGVQRRTAPFYGFFRPVHLSELTAAEAQQLLVNIARLRQQTDLTEFLQTSTGQTRVQAVQHLAGGNPRIYMIFADFLTQQSLAELVSPFMSLVDVLTPYYQSRMQFLSPQQRKIVELLCEKKSPQLVKTIAQRCFMSAQTASSQLKELKEKGYVKVEAIGREAFYDIAEPLMRICLGVKKERGEPLRLIVDFLRVWYPQTELQAMRQALLMAPKQSALICRYLDQAINHEAITDEDPHPTYYKAWESRGDDLLDLNRYEEAIACFDQALKINPENKLVKFLRFSVLRTLNSWAENYKALEVLLNEEKSIDYEVLEPVVWSLFRTIEDPQQWQPNVVKLVNLLEKRSLLTELGVALVNTIDELVSELISLTKAAAWRDAWKAVVGNKPEFEIPLRLLNTALHYKQTPNDPRVLLKLPAEERKILRQALKINDSAIHY